MEGKNENTRIPKQQRSIQSKNQIIEAAMKLFSQKGYHNTNTKEIAKDAGVSTGCFYLYFNDKKAVFMEVLSIYFTQFKNTIRQHMDAFSSEENKKLILKGLIISIIDAHKVFIEFHNELEVMYHSDPEIYNKIEDRNKESIIFTLSLLEKWKDHLKVTDLESAATIVYWTVHGLVDSNVLFKNMILEETLINELTDMLVNYLFK